MRLVVVCVGVAHIGSCSGGLVRNLQCGTGIGFGMDGLEMVGFMFGSGCVAADVAECLNYHVNLAVLLLMVLKWLIL